MLRFIFIAAVGVAIAYCILKLCKSPKGNWQEPLKLLLPLLALVLLLFVLTGKAHLLGILLAGLVPFLKNIAPFILRFGPQFLQKRQSQSDQHDTHESNSQNKPFEPNQHEHGRGHSRTHIQAQQGKMSRAEALSVLGLSDDNPTTEDIKNAHRRLMQKIHPDHGGNDYLAAKLNEAKKILLT